MVFELLFENYEYAFKFMLFFWNESTFDVSVSL